MLKKDRTIIHQKTMIKNRDKIIDEQQEKIAELETTIRDIMTISSNNLLGTDGKVYLRKINELAKTAIQH